MLLVVSLMVQLSLLLSVLRGCSSVLLMATPELSIQVYTRFSSLIKLIN
jgi:uncharacterized protein YceK